METPGHRALARPPPNQVFLLLPWPRPAAQAPEAVGLRKPQLMLMSIRSGLHGLSERRPEGCDASAVGGGSSETSLEHRMAGRHPPWEALSPVGTSTAKLRNRWRQPPREQGEVLLCATQATEAMAGPVQGQRTMAGSSGSHSKTADPLHPGRREERPREEAWERSVPGAIEGRAGLSLWSREVSEAPSTFVAACLWPALLQLPRLTMTKTQHALKGSHQGEVCEQRRVWKGCSTR